MSLKLTIGLCAFTTADVTFTNEAALLRSAPGGKVEEPGRVTWLDRGAPPLRYLNVTNLWREEHASLRSPCQRSSPKLPCRHNARPPHAPRRHAGPLRVDRAGAGYGPWCCGDPRCSKGHYRPKRNLSRWIHDSSDWSQRLLAEKVGTDSTTLSKWLKGTRYLTDTNLVRIALTAHLSIPFVLDMSKAESDKTHENLPTPFPQCRACSFPVGRVDYLPSTLLTLLPKSRVTRSRTRSGLSPVSNVPCSTQPRPA